MARNKLSDICGMTPTSAFNASLQHKQYNKTGGTRVARASLFGNAPSVLNRSQRVMA